MADNDMKNYDFKIIVRDKETKKNLCLIGHETASTVQVAEMLALIHINKFCMDMGAELMYIETLSTKGGEKNG